jgi:histidine triad (HIT) family protein
MPEQEMTKEQQEELRKKLENMSPEELKEFQKKQCIFCHIVSGKVAARKVYEDDKVIAVLDINPANPGHILLMPKEHYMIMPQMPDGEMNHIFMVAKHLSNSLLKALDVRGTNLIVANGGAAGQRAQHFMMHLIPRKEGDGVDFVLPSNNYSDDDLGKTAEMVKKKLGELIDIKEKPKTAQDILKEKNQKKVVEAEFKEQKEEIAEKKEDKKEPEEKKKEEKEIKEPEPKKEEKKEDIDLDDIARVLNGR